MAKNVQMTRVRKIAFPVILAAAHEIRSLLVQGSKNERELAKALDAFKDN